jgi:tetratricopeptide (TPR) repeat protein
LDLRRLRAASFAALLVTQASPALAQTSKPRGAETAVQVSAKARAAYERGAFREAIELYERAYALEQSPTLLFNLGRCYEALAGEADLRAAVEKYAAYLAASKDPPDREAVKRRIEALTEQIRVLEKARLAPAAPVLPPEPPPAPDPPSPWPWVIAGAGGAGLTMGLAFGLVAIQTRDDAEAAATGQETDALNAEASTFSTAATASFIAGGVLTLAGGTWGIVDLVRASDRKTATVRLRFGLASLGVQGEL